ncbi:MAG: M48 family metallopeptidase [Elusimicrobia bacterium]|nr:M48 family metallopeptidase [Elusimicrobiota bacterium]
MGEQAYAETLKKSKVSADQQKVSVVRQVGYRLAKAADKPDFQWEFNVIEDDKQINAWCLPGGKVAFYTGILPVTQDEDGIAVVMGHEIAHALARHGAERMSQGMLAQGVGTVAGAFLGGNPAGQKVFEQAYGLGVGVGIMLPYGRAQESEADHIGLIIMAKAGYDPNKALDFWQRMEKATGGKGGGPLDRYLSTHPINSDRQKAIRGWIPEAMQHYKPRN